MMGLSVCSELTGTDVESYEQWGANMQQMLVEEKFPIFKLAFNKSETPFRSAQDIINHFKRLIDDHKITRFIGEFDHYSHTRGLEQGEIDAAIVDARNIIFCFGTQLPSGEMLAMRPRSIGIAELRDSFIVSFMEAPMPLANDTMEAWVRGLLGPEA